MKIQKRIAWWLIILGVLLQSQLAFAATTILPSGYSCFFGLAPVSGGGGGTGTGFVGLLGTITAGSGGTSGTYGGVALTGGSGSGATANITVSGGGVTAVTILNPGSQYVVGDVLSASAANIGNTTGFSVPISSVAINQALAGGKVSFYVPNTQNPKSTWKDANQATLNQNPVQLDANGCAVIYGVGMYQEVLQDSSGNIVWSALTTDTSAYNSTFWAGLAGGTPNAITVVDTGFNATDGTIINFTALFTNTGPATLNPSAYGAIPILKDTTAGPVSLTGGEIIQTNPISVIYRASDNSFHLLNPPIQSASGNIAPLCGASGLQIVNGSSPNTLIALSANFVVMESGAGLVISRVNISLLNINISTGTATPTINGMDGETPGTSSWLYVWAIDNGASTAGLVSLASGNGLSPALPSGYVYKCLMGAMQVDGSGNLVRILQKGNNSQYQVISGTTLPKVDNGSVGTYSATASPMTAWKAETVRSSTSAPIPPIGVIGNFTVTTGYNGQSTASYAIAPNAFYGGTGGLNPSPCGIPATVNLAYECDMLLEADTIQAASNAAGFGLFVRGFKLGGVNAN